MNSNGRPGAPALSLWPALAALLATTLAVPALHAETDATAAAPPARGLIVRLKDAPAHRGLRNEREQPRDKSAMSEAAETQRWQRVLGETGLSGRSGKREPALRPAGRDQQWLDFGRVLSGAEVEQMREKLSKRSDVDWVEPNVRERRLQFAPVPPIDPLFASSVGQWWLQPVSGSDANAINARLRGVGGFQTAWLRASTAPVVVAVLDTGITAHPDLAGSRVLPGYDFVSVVEYANDGNGRDNDPSDPGDWVSTADLNNGAFSGCAVEDSSWHGTIVSGMVAAQDNNATGGAGIHWGASILPVRVAGKCGADLGDIVDGMRWAGGLAVAGMAPNPNPARVLNISFGGSAACGPMYQTAIDELRNAGVVVVAAAGNEWTRPTRPASCTGVVGVAGLNRDGFKNNFSNFGVELAASGIATVAGDDDDGAWGSVLADTGLVTLTNSGFTVPGAAGYARLYGTSFATPQVAGTLGLMLSVNPGLTHAQLLAGLRLSARPHVTSPKMGTCSVSDPGRCICTTGTCGVGILDAEQALLYAAMPGSYVSPARVGAVIDNADIDRALALAPQDRAAQVAPPVAGGDSGGGAFGAFWLMALATAGICLGATRRR
ncbi:MAG: S8 family peptidase [Rubrivivax sp.]